MIFKNPPWTWPDEEQLIFYYSVLGASLVHYLIFGSIIAVYLGCVPGIIFLVVQVVRWFREFNRKWGPIIDSYVMAALEERKKR